MSKAVLLSPMSNTIHGSSRLKSAISQFKQPEHFRNTARSRTVRDDDTIEELIDLERLFQAWPRRCAYVVEEMVTTERSYLQSLDEVIVGYLKPLYEFLFAESQGSAFLQIVFCNIRKLYEIHLNICNTLLDSYDNPVQFANIFINHVNNFREYILYCTNFPKSEELLQQTMKNNSATRDFILQCQLQIGHPLPLITYLHKPVQRILKYRLLLEQILKGFSENLEGFQEIGEALETMLNIASEINETKRQQENLRRVENIQKSLKGLNLEELGGDLTSCGHLLVEESCKVQGRGGGERLMLLFEKCLLFLKKKGSDGYTYKGHILVEELDLCEQSRSQNTFKVFSVYKPSRPVSVQVRSQSIKDDLVSQVQSLLMKDIEKQKKYVRESLRRKSIIIQEGEQEKRLEDSFENFDMNYERKRMLSTVAHQRSLEASDLQRSRKGKQLSTRESPHRNDVPPLSSLATEAHMPEDNGSHFKKSAESLSSDSGISLSSTLKVDSVGTEVVENQSSELKENPKLQRKTAFRRKSHPSGSKSFDVKSNHKLNTTPIPEDNENFSLSKEQERFENRISDVGIKETSVDRVHIPTDEEVSLDQNIESSLDRGSRTATVSYSQSLDDDCFTTLDVATIPVLPRVTRVRSEPNSTLPDPFLLLGKDKLTDYSVLEEEDEEEEDIETKTQSSSLSETHSQSTEMKSEWNLESSEEDDTCNISQEIGNDMEVDVIRRRSIFSHKFEDSEESLGSNASSLSVEDHYLLTTSRRATVIAGIGGDKITIYDDTEDSESDFEEEEEEEEEVTSEEDDDEIGETDIVENSLRGFLSMAQEWLPRDSMEFMVCPLATLPRTTNEGIFSPFVHRKKQPLLHRRSVDILTSLPMSNSIESDQSKLLSDELFSTLKSEFRNETTSVENLQDVCIDEENGVVPDSLLCNGITTLYEENSLTENHEMKEEDSEFDEELDKENKLVISEMPCTSQRMEITDSKQSLSPDFTEDKQDTQKSPKYLDCAVSGNSLSLDESLVTSHSNIQTSINKQNSLPLDVPTFQESFCMINSSLRTQSPTDNTQTEDMNNSEPHTALQEQFPHNDHHSLISYSEPSLNLILSAGDFSEDEHRNKIVYHQTDDTYNNDNEIPVMKEFEEVIFTPLECAFDSTQKHHTISHSSESSSEIQDPILHRFHSDTITPDNESIIQSHLLNPHFQKSQSLSPQFKHQRHHKKETYRYRTPSPPPVTIEGSDVSVALLESYEQFHDLFDRNEVEAKSNGIETTCPESYDNESEITIRSRGNAPVSQTMPVSSKRDAYEKVFQYELRDKHSERLKRFSRFVKETWLDLQTAVMAKATVSLLSTFVPTVQQSIVLCVLIVVLCFLFNFGRTYFLGNDDINR